MLWLSVLVACESTPSSGSLFRPADVERPAAPAAAAAVDPRFEDGSDDVFRMSSEEMAAGGSTTPEAGAPPDEALAPEAAVALPSAEVAPPGVRFPVRLLSTLPQAQPPRAVLGLPDGKEVVVSPGSILADDGLVVMAVMSGRVQLARIRPAGDHAVIESVELSAQYP